MRAIRRSGDWHFVHRISNPKVLLLTPSGGHVTVPRKGNAAQMAYAPRRARILAACGVLLLCGAMACSKLWPREDSLRDKRLASCERNGERSAPRDERNRCLVEAAKLWSDPEYCDGIESDRVGEGRAECRSDLAEQLGNLKLCKQSGTSTATNRCLSTFALRAEDPLICQQLRDDEAIAKCVREVALQAMRSELCSQLKEEGQRAGCLAQIVRSGGDMAACESIRDMEAREQCYFGAAHRMNASACLKVAPDKRASCLNRDYDLIDDPRRACEGSAQCLSGLVDLGTAACELIPDDQASLRLQCFVAAFGRRDSGPWIRDSECARLATPRLRDECFYGVGCLVDHAGACLRAADAKLRKQCLFVAGKRDASRCLALKDVTDVRRCVADSSLGKTTDTGVCSLLPEERRIGCAQRISSNLEEEMRNAR
jgi:hypothetical protein